MRLSSTPAKESAIQEHRRNSNHLIIDWFATIADLCAGNVDSKHAAYQERSLCWTACNDKHLKLKA
ncbi:MAG: hypothetical protein Q9202_003496 [Teloschistes flavicans]